MPIYVYGCPEKDHPRVEVTHGMKDNPVIRCKVCGEVMRRVPQPFRYGMASHDILVDWMDDNYTRFRAKKPRINKYKVMRPDKATPGRDYHTRR